MDEKMVQDDKIQPSLSSLIENLQSQADSISYEIEKIVDVQKDSSGKVFYQVRLVAYSWLPEDCLAAFQHLIEEFLTSTLLGTGIPKLVSNGCDMMYNANEGSLLPDLVGKCGEGGEGDDEDDVEEEEEEEDEEDEEIDEEDEEQVLEPTMDFKQENIHVDLSEGYPLTTASMVTIGDSMIVDGEPAGDNGANPAPTLVTNTNIALPLYCSKCCQRFYLKSNLEVHVLFCNGNRKYIPEENKGIEVCVSTEEVDSSQNNTSKGEQQVTITWQDQTYEYIPLEELGECATCLQRTTPSLRNNSLADEMKHLIVHSSKKETAEEDVEIYECNECDREFLYMYPAKRTPAASCLEKNLNTPVYPMKKSERPYICSVCMRCFETDSERKEHESKHAVSKSRYTCASCGEKFVTRHDLQEHYATSTLCEPTTCDLCGKTFVHSNHLKRHMSIHAGEKPFTCQICGNGFNQRSDHQRHERKHHVDGKLVCLRCQQTFETLSALENHIMVHKVEEEGERKFTCNQCSKVFRRKSHYKRHLTTHQGIKPHACSKCDKRFNQSTDLKRHEQCHDRKELKGKGKGSKSLDERLECTVCEKVFLTRPAFIEHEGTHHKIMRSTNIMSSGLMF